MPAIGLEAIHRQFADPITYTGADVTAKPITAVYTEEAAGGFPGPGATAKKVSFEIQFVDLPGRPSKGDVIVHKTGSWSVIERSRSRSVNAWVLFVEESP